MLKSSFRKAWPIFVCILYCFFSLSTHAAPAPRFFLSGDGTLVLNQQTIRFRNPDGSYNDGGLKKINQIFQADWADPQEQMSLRFIEILDYIQDQLQGGSYLLKSGYRSPRLNNSLRDQGKLAAQSSMHIEAAAGDLLLSGVESTAVFDFVKTLDCCGIGYYHSRHFHLDTGPSRYWDEKTSKTEDKTPQENEKIILQADYDRYRPGETVDLKFMRVSQYPFGVPPTLELISLDSKQGAVGLPLQAAPRAENGSCVILQERKQARGLQIKLPAQGLPGRYALRVKFCNRYNYSKMPEEILSRSFEIRKELP